MHKKINVTNHKTSNPFWKLRVAVSNPSLAWSYARRTSKVMQLTGASKDEMMSCYSDLERSGIVQMIESELAKYNSYGLGYCGRAPELYVLIRLLKPKVMVETGVANGGSSTFILQAMNDNGFGQLYSIDYPDPGIGNILPENKQTGWLVPQELRHRWKLYLGSSMDILPGLLEELGKIDVFMHDSDHSYDYMLKEMRMAWPYIVDGGLLLADDIWDNSAFSDFCKEVGRTGVTISNVGGVRK